PGRRPPGGGGRCRGPAGEAPRGGFPIGKGCPDVLGGVDGWIRSDRPPRSPMHSARRNAPPGVYRDDRPAGRLDGIGELGRQGLQHCAHSYLRHRRASVSALVSEYGGLPSRAASAERARVGAPFERLEPLQVFDKILLLLVAEAQLEERVVMGHHIEQRREATVVIEPTL